MGENKSETSWRWNVPAIVTVDQGNSVVNFRCRGCTTTVIFEPVDTLFVLQSLLEATIVREFNLDESLAGAPFAVGLSLQILSD